MAKWDRAERTFQVWAYTVSHAQLLLRSVKTDVDETRVDVVFKNVRAMSLCNAFEKLSVQECAVEDLEAATPQSGPNAKGYKLKSERFTGWVVADAMFVHEDDGEYGDPSAIYAPGLVG